MNWKQIKKRKRTEAHRLYQAKKIDRETLGMLLTGRALIQYDRILGWSKDWLGCWGWHFHRHIDVNQK